ncbi:hypothetical protein M569_14415, partial [Genlisea aurea]
FQDQPIPQVGGVRRCRPQEEKERTKLRERQRRAITAKILAGLRRHGNYNLRVRADINDVIAALAREAGWVVLPDGTTFPSRSQGTKPIAGAATVVVSSTLSQLPAESGSPVSLGGGGISPVYRNTVDYNATHSKTPFVPTSSSQASGMMGDGAELPNDSLLGGSVDTVDDKQVVDMPAKLLERDFSGTPFVPVFVMLPVRAVVNKKCELADPDGLVRQLSILRSMNVDGIVVDCWWGIVEAHAPHDYNWNGYKMLFQIVREMKMKIQAVMSFHECGTNVGDDAFVPLPHWVAEIGQRNPDIFFTDRAGRRNPECLSWGVDKERVLGGRTAVEVYFDYMRSFRIEFHDYFENGIISMVVIGLGPRGELRYPSNPVKHGWRFPGIGEFQCYDRYLLKSLQRAAETRGHSFWGRGPENGGSYNSAPHETGFFCDGGDYDGHYGRFFLGWYSGVLLDHADRILSLARLVFGETRIVAKLPGIHWWYKTASHAAELTAGYNNSCNRDGYGAAMAVLKKHGTSALLFPNGEMDFSEEESLADPDGLAWQVTNCGWDSEVEMVLESSLPSNGGGYGYLVEKAKPLGHPDGKHFSSFTFLRLNPLVIMERHNLNEFESFVRKMHG